MIINSSDYSSLNYVYSFQFNGAVNSPDVTLVKDRMIGVWLAGM